LNEVTRLRELNERLAEKLREAESQIINRSLRTYDGQLTELDKKIDKQQAIIDLAVSALERMVDDNTDSGIVFDIAFQTLSKIKEMRGD